MAHAVRLVEPALPRGERRVPRGERRVLAELAVKVASLSPCERLGVLLERMVASDHLLAPLRRRVAAMRSMLSLVPGARRTGPVNTRWGVVENDR